MGAWSVVVWNGRRFAAPDGLPLRVAGVDRGRWARRMLRFGPGPMEGAQRPRAHRGEVPAWMRKLAVGVRGVERRAGGSSPVTAIAGLHPRDRTAGTSRERRERHR